MGDAASKQSQIARKQTASNTQDAQSSVIFQSVRSDRPQENAGPAVAKKSLGSQNTTPALQVSLPRPTFRSKGKGMPSQVKSSSVGLLPNKRAAGVHGRADGNIAGPSRASCYPGDGPGPSRQMISPPQPFPANTQRLKILGGRNEIRLLTSRPLRKTGTRNQDTTDGKSSSVIHAYPLKSSARGPSWQFVDEGYTKNSSKKRPLDDDTPRATGIGFVKRMAVASRPNSTLSRARAVKAITVSSQELSERYIVRGGKLRFMGAGGEVESDSSGDEANHSDSPMDEDVHVFHQPQAEQLATKSAARKREWPPRGSADEEKTSDSLHSDEEDDADAGPADPSSASEDDDADEGPPPPRSLSASPELICLNSPPTLIKALSPSPTLGIRELTLDMPPVPPDELVTAMERLSLPIVRMQKLKLLPFMPRNLRRGFRLCCAKLGIPTNARISERTSAIVRYEHTVDHVNQVFEARMDKWLCPVCELHGVFATREMLAKHLDWDHGDAEFHWEHMQSNIWLLRVVVSLPEERSDIPMAIEDTIPRHLSTPPAHEIGDTTLFPFVTLSPSVSVREAAQMYQRLQIPLPSITKKEEPTCATDKLSHTLRDSVTPAWTSSTRGPSLRSSSARSTTIATEKQTSVPPGAMSHLEQSRPVTPPPASNRLGPAWNGTLPFRSQCGGPDLYYSCRPGGQATVFDLLNTLPLEPFGVLAWDVLDREDEIFDSDNVSDEYKVMHALWGRWIVLNRITFIGDHYRGTLAFVDAYWRMIHYAAGWDALRYWLLMLLINRFLSGHQVAEVLKRYEALVGMDSWD